MIPSVYMFEAADTGGCHHAPLRVDSCIFRSIHEGQLDSLPVTSLAEKVNAILEPYLCFSVSAASLVPESNNKYTPRHNPHRPPGVDQHHGGRRYRAGGGSNNTLTVQSQSYHHQQHKDDTSWKIHRLQQQRQQLPCVSNTSTLVKTVNACLNKLSVQNFASVSRKILDYPSSKTDVMQVAEAVLTKCYREPGYIHLYVNLLEGLVDSQESVISLVEAFMRESIASFQTDDFGESQSATENYDAFCASIKRSQHALGKNRTIISLIDRRLVAMSKESYFIILIDLFDKSVPSKRAELALDFIAGYVECFGTENIESEKVLMHNTFDRFFSGKKPSGGGGNGAHRRRSGKVGGASTSSRDTTERCQKIKFKIMHIRDMTRVSSA